MINLNIDLLVMIEYNFLNERISTGFTECSRYNGDITPYHKEIVMSENEVKLIEMIRNHPNPDKAFVTALEVVLLFLKHL